MQFQFLTPGTVDRIYDHINEYDETLKKGIKNMTDFLESGKCNNEEDKSNLTQIRDLLIQQRENLDFYRNLDFNDKEAETILYQAKQIIPLAHLRHQHQLITLGFLEEPPLDD